MKKEEDYKCMSNSGDRLFDVFYAGSLWRRGKIVLLSGETKKLMFYTPKTMNV